MPHRRRSTGAPEIDALVARHTDDEALLKALVTYIEIGEERLLLARQMRDEAAMRLREAGALTNREIAALAGVGDSYLSRQSLKAGAKPRVERKGNR